MATKTVTLGTAAIGPQSWRSNTLNGIKLSQNVINRSDKSCELGRSVDPLPNLRDTVAELSNDEAHRYFRQIRSVVFQLRESLLDTNEEIKSLTRVKEALEKQLDHTRKDLKVNQDCKSGREQRPAREKPHDGADDLLHAERMHLLNMKRMLEGHLLLVQQQLQVLDKCRKRLSDVTLERSRVMDLICHAVPAVSASTGSVLMRSKTLGSFSYSAPQVRASSGSFLAPDIDPLGAYTPEVDAALREAKDARTRSATLRKDGNDLVAKTDKMQKAAHKSVNDGMAQKLAETVTLKQHLQTASGETRHGLHRAQRWYDATENAWGISRGPLYNGDLNTHERLERPIMSVFQRHPGNNMPEAQEIVQGGDGLLQSLKNTSRNIGLLRLAQLQLQDDIRDKNAALDVDGDIVRMRRRKANHRWVTGAAF